MAMVRRGGYSLNWPRILASGAVYAARRWGGPALRAAGRAAYGAWYNRRGFGGPSMRYKGPPNRGVMSIPRGLVQRGGFNGRFQPSGRELKYFDYATENGRAFRGGATKVASDATEAGEPAYSFPCLVPIAQGQSENTRIGNRAVIKKLSVHIRATQSKNPGSGAGITDPNASARCRLIIFVDKQNNNIDGTTATTDVSPDKLLDTSANVGTAVAIDCFRNMEYNDRFTILWDHRFVLTSEIEYDSTATNLMAQFPMTKVISKTLTCNIPVYFSATTGAKTSITSNNIGMFMLQEHVPGVYNYVRYDGSVRLRFHD